MIFNIDFELLFFRIKLFSGILSLVFISLAILFIYLFQKLVAHKRQLSKAALHSVTPASSGAGQSKWAEIQHHINSPREAEWKFAVVEADNLVDGLLKSAGYPGVSMGERLMSIEKGQLANLEGLWEAHKIRNKLVHDANYFLRHAEARRAVQLYELVLKELGAV